MAKQELSRLVKAIVETADGMRRTGIMDGDAYAKITPRHLAMPTGAADPISGEEIRQVREEAHRARPCLPAASTSRPATCPSSNAARSGRPARRWYC